MTRRDPGSGTGRGLHSPTPIGYNDPLRPWPRTTSPTINSTPGSPSNTRYGHTLPPNNDNNTDYENDNDDDDDDVAYTDFSGAQGSALQSLPMGTEFDRNDGDRADVLGLGLVSDFIRGEHPSATQSGSSSVGSSFRRAGSRLSEIVSPARGRASPAAVAPLTSRTKGSSRSRATAARSTSRGPLGRSRREYVNLDADDTIQDLASPTAYDDDLDEELFDANQFGVDNDNHNLPRNPDTRRGRNDHHQQALPLQHLSAATLIDIDGAQQQPATIHPTIIHGTTMQKDTKDIRPQYDTSTTTNDTLHDASTSTTGPAAPARTDEGVPNRVIYVNQEAPEGAKKGSSFMGNSVSTAKYSAFSFLPKFFFEQFSRYANLFFLFTAIIQQIGNLSPTSRYGTVIPLSVVLLLAAVKEIVEDAKRHSQDSETNSRLVQVFRDHTFKERPWRNVVVGDIVRIENGKFFPADLLVLSSSEPDALCYIETANLDGETNLKIRQGLTETNELLSADSLINFKPVIKCEPPNNSLYTFEGVLELNGRNIPVTPNQILLRGAQLRNTRWVYGIVVYTGHETKLMKNATAAPIKRTKVENMVNRQIIFLFFVLIAMSVFCSFGALIRQISSPFEHNYLYMTTGAWAMFPQNFLTYIILFNNVIPLSLVMTMDAVKFLLGNFINWDLDMYYEKTDTHALSRTSSLVEELGQVDYIFSDKTGTLTCNIMEFKMASIGGQAVAVDVPEHKRSEGEWISFDKLRANKSNIAMEFGILLGVCHTVIPERNETTGEIVMQASSPDEAALVKGAMHFGVEFHTRRPKSVTINVDGVDQEYEILNVNEFNSTRKRMSVVVRCPNGEIKLFIKGADTVILNRLAKNGSTQRYLDETQVHLEEYATEGLRTLCVASKTIDPHFYEQWAVKYERAATTIANRQDALDRCAELIETDLTLLGATAIEDKLQDDVPETIHTLAEAGIKIWVLTGDRQETAINIGFSCRLLTVEMNLIIINESTREGTRKQLVKKLESVRHNMPKSMMDHPHNSMNRGRGFFFSKRPQFDKDQEVDFGEPLGLIIDGRSLDFALESDLRLLFLELATMCKAVICCRVSPLQKALVVKLVRKNVDESVTLAIGDGANDVGMIQAAHVGVGISGQEGLQASRSADFSIAQFRYLRKLLLVHGGWAYVRMSRLILFSFYKNIVLYLVALWFAIDSGFSGQTIFETWSSISSYNVLWTIAQPVAIGVFDQYTSAVMLDRYPQLYRLGQKSVFYNHPAFLGYLLNSFFHSAVIYYLWREVYYYAGGIVSHDGPGADLWLLGEAIFVTVLVVVGLKAALVTNTYVKFSLAAFFGSILLFFILFPIYAEVGPKIGISTELEGIDSLLFGTWVFWFGIVIIPLVSMFRDFVWKYYRRRHMPQSYHIIQEVQKYNIPDYRPRMEWFRKAVHKARMIRRMKRSRGYAFSQNESGQADLIRLYDTTRRKPQG